MTDVLNNKAALALIAGLGYAFATLLMKMISGTPTAALILCLIAILAGTALAETSLLRQANLGLAYIAIIATETLLVLCYGYTIGEGLSGKEMIGGAFVVTGVALVSL